MNESTKIAAGHGPNIGHGYVKYIVISSNGKELTPVVFPAMIGRARRQLEGALHQADVVTVGGAHYWTGDDALLAPSPITMLAQDRLSDPAFIPALVKGALDRFGHLNGASIGTCVTGLPATWALDTDKAKALGERLRAATPNYKSIKVIPEPLGLIYSMLLDNEGQIVGDRALQTGRIGVVDMGHLTVDVAVIHKLAPIKESLDTYQLGTARPLQQIRSQLTATFERELSLHETDLAVRAEALTVAGQPRALPLTWDRPLIDNGSAIATRLGEAWGTGAQLDAILIGGGGAELAPLVEAIQRKFPHAVAVVEPQLAIARGYARMARRVGGAQ